MEKIINPKPINKSNFFKYGEVITTEQIKPMKINNGYAQRFDGIAILDTKNQNGETTISIFSALKRTFPMKIDMMEKHPLGSQAFVPMNETEFLVFVAPKGKKPNTKKIKSFIVPKQTAINYKPGIWHFPLISKKSMNFLVIDRKGIGNNLVIYKFKNEKISLKYK